MDRNVALIKKFCASLDTKYLKLLDYDTKKFFIITAEYVLKNNIGSKQGIAKIVLNTLLKDEEVLDYKTLFVLGPSSGKDYKNPDWLRELLRFVIKKAEYGRTNRFTTKSSDRKILLVGVPYYWHNTHIPFDEMPECFHKFVKYYGLEGFNSVLWNVYEHKKSSIAPHMDKTDILDPNNGEVVSFSFALNEKDEKDKLADIQFSGGPHEDTLFELYHNSVITFDAFADKRDKRKHQVRNTILPRVNATFRHLKNPTVL